jgi:hypothetical protein
MVTKESVAITLPDKCLHCHSNHAHSDLYGASCNAQVRQPQHDRNTDVSELAEVAVDVGMKKRADDAGGINQASTPNDARELHEGFRGRKVRVGLYENKPKVYTSDTGQPAGIFIELLDEIARKEK